MKSIIEYEYRIEIDEIRKYEDRYYIRNKDNTYILEKTIKNEEMLNLINQSKLFYTVMHNNKGNLSILYNSEKYILYRIENDTNQEQDLYIEEKPQKDWGKLWSIKVDKIRKEMLNHRTSESIDYYIGLAENAIMLWNKIDKNNLKYKICRIRMNNDVLKNPNNAIIDIIERDAAENIKYLFFYENTNVETITEKYNKDGLDMGTIYCRLLFPTYFFDQIEDYLIKGKINSRQINKIIDKQRKYEEYLNYFSDKYIKKLRH